MLYANLGSGRAESPRPRGAESTAKVPKQYIFASAITAYDVENRIPGGPPAMAANQVILYFEKQEDALQFTLAASSIIADGAPLRETALKVAREVSKAMRITAAGSLNPEERKAKAHSNRF
jgi:hypothetical protein